MLKQAASMQEVLLLDHVNKCTEGDIAKGSEKLLQILQLKCYPLPGAH